MKNLFIALALMAILPRVAIGQKGQGNIYSFGKITERPVPVLNRHGRYGDSARRYMWLAQHAKSWDSSGYYMTLMNFHRHMESWRQAVVVDSGWREEMRNKVNNWRIYHGGTKVVDQLAGDAILAALDYNRLFLNTANHIVSCPGEYVPMDLDLDGGTFYSHQGNGIPTLIPGAPSNGAIPLGGPHNAGGVTALPAGQLWMYGQWVPTGAAGMSNGSSSMVQITTDSLGNYIDPVVQVFLSGTNYGNFWNGGFVTSTGKGYVIGELESGIEANGTWGNPWAPKPIQVTLPGGRLFKKIQGGYFMLALATDGTVWSWGGGGYNYWLMQGNSPTWTTPGQVPLPAGYTATDIASNGVFSEVLCLDASGNQHLMGGAQQYYDDYLGWPTGSGHLTTSIQDISSNFYPYLGSGETTHKIASIAVNSNATYFIMDNGWAYGWGGTPCGELGIGSMLNFAQSSGSGLASSYFWDFSVHIQMQQHPARIMPGAHNLKSVLSCQSNSFYITLLDSTNNAYSAGRNKGQAQIVSIPQDSTTALVNANPTAGKQGGTKPDSWNEKYMTPNHAGRVSKSVQVASPYCILNPTDATNCGSAAQGNGFTNPAHGTITGSLSATYSNNAITVSASGKTATNGLVIMRMQWSQLDSSTAHSYLDISTPNINTLVIKTSQDAQIAAGPYMLGWMGITNASDTVRDSVQIVVNVGSPSVSVTPANQTIYLPATTGTLACTASGANGATVTGYAWTQLYGPNTATMGSPSSASTSISGLIQGTYEFQIKITDSNGNTATATTFVYVYHSFNGLTVPLPTTFKHS